MSESSPPSSQRWRWNEVFPPQHRILVCGTTLMLQSPPACTSSSLPLKLESSCWSSMEAGVRTCAKTTPLSGSSFFCDIVPDYLINTHLKMWPPPGTLTEVQFPDTVPTTNLLAGDSLQKNWPQPHSHPVFSFPFQATLEKCSLITEYQRDFATIPTCCPPSHPET